MPFYELHPLNYTILHYTKGDLFSMLYGSFSILYRSFLDIQTLSPKVSLVIIRKEKRWQAIQQKINCPDLFSAFLFFLFYFRTMPVSKKWKLLWFLEKSLPTGIHMSDQYAFN